MYFLAKYPMAYPARAAIAGDGRRRPFPSRGPHAVHRRAHSSLKRRPFAPYPPCTQPGQGKADETPAPVDRSGPRDRLAAGANGKPDKITHRLVKTRGVTMQLQELVDGDPQVFSPARLAGVLRTTKAEIVGTLGLSRDALSRLASPGPEDADPAAGDGGDPPPRRGIYRILSTRRLRLFPLGGIAGIPPARRPISLYAKARQVTCMPVSTGSWQAGTLETPPYPAGADPNGR